MDHSSTDDIPRSDSSVSPRHRRWSWAALLAVGLAVVLLIVAMLAGFGTRWGFWTFRTGFSLLRGPVLYGIFALVAISLFALFHSRPGSGRRGLPLAAGSLVVALAVLGYLAQWRGRAQAAPPIHDISTDTQSPPEFVAIRPLRADAPNPIEYGGPEVAAQQREAYPDIEPLLLEFPAERAFERALRAARDMGWEIVAADSAAGLIEATDRTFWFGFKDDIVIRLSPLDGRTVLDVRSLSRVGGGDAGTNARRVRAYLETVRALPR